MPPDRKRSLLYNGNAKRSECGIINPSSEDMMKSWYAYHALMNLDNNCEQYIQKYANSVVSTNIMKTSELSETKLKGENDRSRKSSSKMTLQEAIEKGCGMTRGKLQQI